MKFQDFVCGIFAGWSQIIFGQPLDYIKVRLQTELQSNKKSIIQISRQISKQHGLKGFYRGSSSLFFGFAFTIGTQFAVYQFCKRHIYSYRQKKDKQKYTDTSLSIIDVGLAGAIVGLSVSVIVCPVQYVKIKKQMNPQIKKGSFLLLIEQIKNNQLKNITKGLNATILRQTFGSAIYYASYQYLVRLFSKSRQNVNTWNYVLAGGLAGLSYWVVSYPFDVVKTKVQNGQSYENAFRSLLSSSYKGFSVVFIRSLLVNGMSFCVYQHTKSGFQYLKAKQRINQ